MFNLINPFAKNVEVKKISEEELNQMRAARISEAMPIENKIAKRAPFREPLDEKKILPSGTGLIKGIEFEMDEVPVKVPGAETGVFMPVRTFYPAVNQYIGEKMDFEQIHGYNNPQNIYFENSASVLFAQRIKFLMNGIISAYQMDLGAISVAMKKEAKEISKLAGKNCRDCDEGFCGECPGNTYTNLRAFLSINDVVDLMPQLIDPNFYNTIKNKGGIFSNQEIIQVTTMAFAAILLNKINIDTIDEVSYAKAMNDVNTSIQNASQRLIDMIRNVIEKENIPNLFEYDDYLWARRISVSQIAEKL